MKLVTGKEMQTIDKQATADYKIPSLLLMENAGIRVAQAVQRYLEPPIQNRKVLVLAGIGNNGGDGLVAARHLLNAGVDVKVFLLARADEIKGDAGVNLTILRQMGIPLKAILDNRDLNVVKLALLTADLVIDAIYGTGFRGTVPPLIAQVIRLVNGREKPVLAVDLPSGLAADTGKATGAVIQATGTVTLALPKLGLVLEPGAGLAGNLEVADISIPQTLIDKQELTRDLLDRCWCVKQMVMRNPEGHKGDYGHVLVLGGSEGLTGAAVLACAAALRTGAGLVTAGVPQSLNSIMENKLTEVMSLPLPETDRRTLAPAGLELLKPRLKGFAAVAVGPGLSRYPEALEYLLELLSMVSQPLIIDADGLNALAEDVSILEAAAGPVILTPHPGEMARLLGVPIAEIQQNRLETAVQAAAKWGAVVVLKGNRTIIAAADGRVCVNPTGNPGLATAGTGDVLTGMIAGLAAQGLEPAAAAALGVYLHGLVGDRVQQEKGMRGLIAGDLIEYLPTVLRELEKEAGQGG